MGFIEVVWQTAPTFRERKIIYFHCFDLGAQESFQFEQFPCLQVNLVLGHVSFLERIAERRMCGFLFQEKVLNLLRDRPSPVLLEVTNSCNIKMRFSAVHFFVLGLAFNCSFIVYSMLAKPISIVCLICPMKHCQTCFTFIILGRASRRLLLGLICVWTIRGLQISITPVLIDQIVNSRHCQSISLSKALINVGFNQFTWSFWPCAPFI